MFWQYQIMTLADTHSGLSLLQLLFHFVSVHFQHLVGFLERAESLDLLQLLLLLGQSLCCGLKHKSSFAPKTSR